jgi:hypothetical protein
MALREHDESAEGMPCGGHMQGGRRLSATHLTGIVWERNTGSEGSSSRGVLSSVSTS